MDGWEFGSFLDQKVLAPEIENVPPGNILIIILELYKVHLMGSVGNKIKDLGAEVWHICGGYTSLYQTNDYGFKHQQAIERLHLWSMGWLDSWGKSPTNKGVVNWKVDENNAISNVFIRNAWSHRQYSWFEWGGGWPRRSK